MAEFGPLMTQHEPVPPIAAELAAAGFEDAHAPVIGMSATGSRPL